MRDSYAGELERVLADGLGPAVAPESLWYRVDAELAGRHAAPRRTVARLALAFGVMLVAVVSVGWYLDRPAPAGSSVTRPVQVTRGEHSCMQCHV